jgi:putative colanic acid biosynthesis acetyltransferase WcaF
VVRDLAAFDGAGYDKARPAAVQALWFAVQSTLFSAWFCPARLRVTLLRLFGAQIGERVFIRHRVRVLWPWKLRIGDDSWIGEGAWLLNLEPITVGTNVCLSQEAFLCTGSHDYADAAFGYRNAPITVEDGAWVAARATVLPGVTVGTCAVVAAGTVVSHDVAPLTLVGPGGTRPLREPA